MRKKIAHNLIIINKIRFYNLIVILGLAFFLNSCGVLSTSMSPSQVNELLPILTKSRFVSQVQADEDIKNHKCVYLVKGRNYAAPIGLTTKDDLKNGAKGIDEWVKIDGGNAYVLIGYKWITVDHLGSTQLHVEFNTILYE